MRLRSSLSSQVMQPQCTVKHWTGWAWLHVQHTDLCCCQASPYRADSLVVVQMQALMNSLTPQQQAQIHSLAPNQQDVLLQRILMMQSKAQQTSNPGSPALSQQGSAQSAQGHLQPHSSLGHPHSSSGQLQQHPSLGQLGQQQQQQPPGLGQAQAGSVQLQGHPSPRHPQPQLKPELGAGQLQSQPSASQTPAILAAQGHPGLTQQPQQQQPATDPAEQARRLAAQQQLQQQLLSHLNPQQMQTLRSMPRVRAPCARYLLCSKAVAAGSAVLPSLLRPSLAFRASQQAAASGTRSVSDLQPACAGATAAVHGPDAAGLAPAGATACLAEGEAQCHLLSATSPWFCSLLERAH